MKNGIEITYKICPNSRAHTSRHENEDDQDELIKIEDDRFWKNAKKYLNRQFSFQDRILKHTQTLNCGTIIGEFEITFKFPSSKDDFVGCCNFASYLIHSLAFDLFFILNLSRPGCIDYFNFRLKLQTKLPCGISKSDLIKQKILKISSSTGFSDIRRGRFSKITKIEPTSLAIEKVTNWYFKIRSGYSQLPSTHIERVLFAIFHVVVANPASLPEYIWAAHAFEAMFNSRRSDPFGVVSDRSLKFLDVDKRDFQKAKKELREFYRIRSKFAHGEFDIYHPNRNDILDSKVSILIYDLYGPLDFVLHMIVLSLQKMVERDFHSFEVHEELLGVSK